MSVSFRKKMKIGSRESSIRIDSRGGSVPAEETRKDRQKWPWKYRVRSQTLLSGVARELVCEKNQCHRRWRRFYSLRKRSNRRRFSTNRLSSPEVQLRQTCSLTEELSKRGLQEQHETKQLQSIATTTKVQYQHSKIDMINTQTMQNVFAFEQTKRRIDLSIVEYFVAIILSKNLSPIQRNLSDTLMQGDLLVIRRSLNVILKNLCSTQWNFTQEYLNVVQKDMFVPVGSSYVMQKILVDTEKNLVDTEQNLVDTEQNLVDTEQNLVDTEQNLVDTEQNLVDTEQNLADTEQNLADTEQNLVDTEQNLADTKRGLCDRETNLRVLQKNSYASESGVYVVHNDENVVQHDISMVIRLVVEQMNFVKVTDKNVANDGEQHSVKDNIREAQIPLKILRPAAHSAGCFRNSFETVAGIVATMPGKRGVTSAASRTVLRGTTGTSATARKAARRAARVPLGSVSSQAHGCIATRLFRDSNLRGSTPIHTTPQKMISEKTMRPEKVPRAFLDKAPRNFLESFQQFSEEKGHHLERSSPDATATKPAKSVGGANKDIANKGTTNPGNTDKPPNKGTTNLGTTDKSVPDYVTTNPGTTGSSSNSTTDNANKSTTTDNSSKSTSTDNSNSSFGEGGSNSCSSTSSADNVEPVIKTDRTKKKKIDIHEDVSTFVPTESHTMESDTTESDTTEGPYAPGPGGTEIIDLSTLSDERDDSPEHDKKQTNPNITNAGDETPNSNLHVIPAAVVGSQLGSKIGTALGALGVAAYALSKAELTPPVSDPDAVEADGKRLNPRFSELYWKPPVGQRNTIPPVICWFNSATQALLSLPPFVKALKNYTGENSWVLALQKILEKQWSSMVRVEDAQKDKGCMTAASTVKFYRTESTIDVNAELKEATHDFSDFEEGQQQDSNEFLQKWKDKIQEASDIYSLFEIDFFPDIATNTHTLTKKVRDHASANMLILNLPEDASKKSSISDLIKKEFYYEVVRGATKDEKNGGTQEVKERVQMAIKNPPPILHISLNRFAVKFGPTNQVPTASKSNYDVALDETLDLTGFLLFGDDGSGKGGQRNGEPLPKKNQGIYHLYSVVEHKGSVNGGHYWAKAKVGPGSGAGSTKGEWMIFNDIPSRGDSDPAPTDLPRGGVEPYQLFYIREDMIQEGEEFWGVMKAAGSE